jgi:hypothetical protein
MSPSTNDPIYYLRGFLEAPVGLNQVFSSPLLGIVGHFYIQAQDDTTAGAVAHDYCQLQGLEFKEYLVLPTVISRQHIGVHEHEHMQAFELAAVEGEAVVLSLVLGKLRST